MRQSISHARGDTLTAVASDAVASDELASNQVASDSEAALALRLMGELRGAVLATEVVTDRDLIDATAELWQAGYLRRGRASVDLADVRAQLRLVFLDSEKAGRYCAGFELEAMRPAGAETSLLFPLDCLDFVAARAARRLIESGTLSVGAAYYYELGSGEGSGFLAASDCEALVIPVRGPEGRRAPGVLLLPIRLLRERVSVAAEHSDAANYPVFITREARERAERISRKGAASQPPVETGGLLIGPLCVCPETGEMFAVVCDVLEATDAEATTYSLTYSGPTWARIQNIMRARQANPATRHHRILGQAHGHNFVPAEGAAPCEWCHLQPKCTRTSAYLSADDRNWCRAIFSAEPWQLSIVYGLDALTRPVEAFYGQRGGGLERRSYAIIDGLDGIPFEVSLESSPEASTGFPNALNSEIPS